MIKTLITTGLLYGLLQQPALPEILNGSVSTDIDQSDLQAEMQIDLSKFHNARSDIYSSGVYSSGIHSGNTTMYSSGIQQTNIYVQLNAASQPQLERLQARQQRPNHELSAIGVKITHSPADRIYYIDANSDLVGKVQLGDRLLTVNGEESTRATRARHNLGNEQTLVNVQVLHQDGKLENMQCYRHPISYFSPEWSRLY